MLVDSGQQIASASDGIQYIVNEVALEPQVIVPGTPAFVGVEDPNGFTDLAIVAVGGATQDYIADQFSFLPLASFAP
jgi:hypothetical protein